MPSPTPPMTWLTPSIPWSPCWYPMTLRPLRWLMAGLVNSSCIARSMASITPPMKWGLWLWASSWLSCWDCKKERGYTPPFLFFFSASRPRIRRDELPLYHSSSNLSIGKINNKSNARNPKIRQNGKNL